jgi:hypothetical protein
VDSKPGWRVKATQGYLTTVARIFKESRKGMQGYASLRKGMQGYARVFEIFF